MGNSLTKSDVAELLSEPTAERRAITAQKISEQFVAGVFSDEERTLAEEIFKLMVKDAEVRVREALSESLKNCYDIPYEIAISLARDVDEVALPMLEFSEILSDEDLVQILKNQGVEAQKAIANRATISAELADNIVDCNEDVTVVTTLMKNEGAILQEHTMNKVLDQYGEEEAVNVSLAYRKHLPINISERLVNLVSEKVRDHLVTHHEMSPKTAMKLFFNARERAIANLIHDNDGELGFEELVNQLYENGRLTETLILKALCFGDVIFFEAALAKLADIPVTNAYKLVHDRGELGLKAILEKCDFSLELVPIITAALQVAKEMAEYETDNLERYRTRMLERVLTRCEGLADKEKLNYFLTQIAETDAA